MPQKNPRLTATDHQRIQEYRSQGLTRTAIAEKMGCGYHQVRKYLDNLRDLRNLHDATRVRVPITKSQYLIIIRFQQSGLNTRLIAARLQIDTAILYQELAGEKSMSTQRVGALQKILAEKMPVEKRRSKRGRPPGSSAARGNAARR